MDTVHRAIDSLRLDGRVRCTMIQLSGLSAPTDWVAG
jgi:hypothetical protein